MAYVSVSIESIPTTGATAYATTSSSTTHIDLGSKGWNFSLYVRKYSWELFPLCFDSLVQLISIVCCAGFLLARFSSGTLAIFLGFEIVSLLDFTIFLCILTWGSGRSLFSPPNPGIIGNFLEYFFIVSSWLGWSGFGLLSFRRHSGGLIVYNVETGCKLYFIMCQ